MSIISDKIQLFFELFGWPILIVCIAIYFSRNYIREKLRNMRLAQANNPQRRSILDKEVKRARLVQQLDVYKANRNLREMKDV